MLLQIFYEAEAERFPKIVVEESINLNNIYINKEIMEQIKYSKTQIFFSLMGLLLASGIYFFHFEEQTLNYLIVGFCFSICVWFTLELFGKIKEANNGTYHLVNGIRGINKSFLASYLFGVGSMVLCIVYFIKRLHLFE